MILLQKGIRNKIFNSFLCDSRQFVFQTDAWRFLNCHIRPGTYFCGNFFLIIAFHVF